MASLWLDSSSAPLPALVGDQRCDVAIVGAGLTGLTLAVLLARAGVSVVVVEAAYVGAGTTGHTTAKISLLQGTRLSTISAKHPSETLLNYVEANREGQAWLLRYCDEHDVPYETAPAFTYAGTSDGRRSIDQEAEACQRAHLPVAVVEDTDLPFVTYGAVCLADQAQFDPMNALAALIHDFVAREGRVYTHSRVRKVRTGSPHAVVTDAGMVSADTVVLATGAPILDRGGYFARLEPQRSYAQAFRLPGPIPAGMYLSADSPTRSIRSVPDETARRLLVGGNGHPVGRFRPTSDRVADLTEWTTRHFRGAELTHTWSAQDYRAVDDLPYVGPLLPWSENVLFASGFAKWGMTNAVAAALALSNRLLGGSTPPWAQAYQSWSPHELKGVFDAAKANATVAIELGKGWLLPKASSTVPPTEGDGVIERSGLHPVAACTVNGQTTRVSGVCTHLGRVVNWNDAERSWDCPLHGSRFAADGTVLEGPATKDLAPASQS